MITDTPQLIVKRMIRFNGEGTLKAYVDLAIGDLFIIRGLRLIEGRHGLFVSMPRQQGKDGRWYDNMSILTKEIKSELNRIVLESYQQDETNQ